MRNSALVTDAVFSALAICSSHFCMCLIYFVFRETRQNWSSESCSPSQLTFFSNDYQHYYLKIVEQKGFFPPKLLRSLELQDLLNIMHFQPLEIFFLSFFCMFNEREKVVSMAAAYRTDLGLGISI